MSCQQLLVDATLALNTNKKKDRLSALESLSDYLNQERIVRSLHKNSKLKDNSITWDIVFIRIHNAVLSVVDENNSKNGQMFDKHLQIIQNIVLQVVQKSIYQGDILIDSNLIASCTLAVFESYSRIKFLGSTYLNLFAKYAISGKKNWNNLKEEYWIGMKNLCKSQVNVPQNGIHNILFLEILIDIVRYSSKCVQISYNFLDLFDFVKNIFVSHKKSGSTFEIALLRLTNTLCLQLAIEFRYEVCEFMENVFDFVINLHEKKKPEKNILVYHFLTTTLNVHNPNGLWEDKCSYACNLKKWKFQIKETFLLCLEEVKLILKNPNMSEVENDFLDLFVYVTHMVSVCSFENCPKVSDVEVSFDEPGPSNKRKCSIEAETQTFKRVKQIKIEGPLKTLLKDLQTSDGWFWLRFLELLLHKYPSDLKNEYCQFVEVLFQLLSNKRDAHITRTCIRHQNYLSYFEQIFRCLCGFLDLENSLDIDLTNMQIQWLNEIWTKISIELTRSLQAETYSESHLLIRSLISHFKLRYPENLLKLYCNGILKSNADNFKTLCVICQNCILPEILVLENRFKTSQENFSNVRSHLLSWLLQGVEKYPCKDMSKALIALILKRFDEELETCTAKDDILISRNSIGDFCKLITSNFMSVAFKNIKFVEDSSIVENNLATRLDSGMKSKLFELILFRGKNLVDNLKEQDVDFEEQLKLVKNCLWFCELLCHLLSHFEYMCGSVEDISCLTEELKSLLYLCSSISRNLITVKFFDLTCFSNLYDANFHPNVQNKIRNSDFISLDFVKAVFELFTQRNKGDESFVIYENNDDIQSTSRFSQLIKNSQSILHFRSLTKREQLIINSVEFLCHYISVYGSYNDNCYQANLAVNILNNLTCDEFLKTYSNFQLQLIFRAVYCFTKYNGITSSVLNSCLDLLQHIFDCRPTNSEVLIIILQILKDLTVSVHKISNLDAQLKFMKIIDGFRNVVFIKKNCGTKVVSKFIECLAEISKVDLEGNWAVVEKNGSYFRVVEDMILFLKHQYHEIRLMAARHIGLLFLCSKNLKDTMVSWQKKLLENLFEILRDNLGLSSKERRCAVEYFNYVTTSVSLIAWASIICLSRYWRKRALFNLLHLSFLKNFKNSEVEDILKLICKELKIKSTIEYFSPNLAYLLNLWAENKLQIQDFPFYLLGCKTFDDFIHNNSPIVVTTYAQKGQIDIINLVSTRLKKSVYQILKDCHSMLIAFVLPSLSENTECETAKKAQKLKRFIDQEVTSKTSILWLTDSLDEVIFNIIRNMHDPLYLKKCKFSGNIEDEKCQEGFNVPQILDTLENLSTNEGNPLLGKVALEVPTMIEKILLFLLGDIEQAVIYEDKVLAFYKYIFFVEIISKVTSKGSVYCNINNFIIRDVIYTLVTIIAKDDGKSLTTMACECLHKMALYYLKEFSAIFGKFLPAITTVLTPIAKNLNAEALNVLNFLLCENYEKLKSDIALLDPFPPDEIFYEINQKMEKAQNSSRNLKSTIKHFIQAGRSKNSGCRIEGLKNLREMLSKEKIELKEMYEELKMSRGFSEDCKESLLHQLICMLVELTSDKNTVIKTEAANCLGELGPSDLTTLVLRPENNFTASKETVTAINRLIKSSLIILSDLIVSSNFEVKKASSKALYAVLSVRQAREVIQFSNGSLNVKYLTPFLSFSGDNLQLKIRKEIFVEKLNNPEIWRPDSHEKWIVNLMNGLLESLTDFHGLINTFIELINVNWQFAEFIFPSVLDFVLSLKDERCSGVINKNLNIFFEENFDYKDKSPTLNKMSVQCLVNVVDYIRIQRSHQGIYQDFELNINYLHVAKAALYCSAFFTAVFYAELWFEEKRKEKNMYMDINTICEFLPESFVLTEILRVCHSKIGNSDGIHGCGYMHILNPASEIQHYEHLKNWSVSMLHHDIQLSQGNTNSEIGLLNSLERSGMYYTLNNLMKVNSELPDVAAIQYKCAARLRDWSQLDLTCQFNNNVTYDNFEKYYYFALKAFHDEDNATFLNEIHKARKSVLSELAYCSLESSKNLYLPISELQCLKELEEFALVVRNMNKSKLQNLFNKWNSQDDIKCSDFKLIESVLTNRTIVIRDRLEKTEDPNLKTYLQLVLCEMYYKLTVAARKEKKYQTAIRTLSFLNVNEVPEEIAGKVKLEKARILWERGDNEIGRFLLSHFLKSNDITGELKAKSLRIYGDWMAKTKSENSREIIENYYLKSISQSNESDNQIDSFFSLAKFADSNYEQLNEYLSSPLFEIKQNLINTQQDLASELRQELGWNQNREKRMAYQIAAKQSAIDENEIKNSKAERDSYLNLALKYYLLSLKEGEKYNLVIFRVISLWLSNASSPEVIQQLQKILHQIPTYKFLCLLPQLVPRMVDVCLISDLIEKILQDHPYHTLPLIFALNNSYEDLKYNGVKTAFNTPRVLAARSMLEKFQNSPKLEKFIVEMRNFSSALIELANHNPADKGKAGCQINFPEHLKIRHITNLTSVAVPSLHIPYDKKCIYDGIVGVHRFEENYYLVGGVNLPKRIKCIGTDGISRTLLVKGKDDLRQDAVMQQVFTIMNSLLYQNSETNKRKLVIRTYKVVPLSQRSGVIEWCENTQPLSLYLTGPDGKSGAHKKFYPNDIVAFEGRCMIRNVFAQPQVTNEDKLKVFLDVCEKIHPVFHHFFIEKFPAAGVWFERRLAYIHSVATSSMIGYILGIGDRHVHNILIDNATAEVIHIDLGIAFEQGKTLPTPETVPFRLTRDIVDGMGLTGIEGDFRISCNKTMEVLRDNQDTILTLLEVLLYDPLYTWTITPEKAYSMQNHTETSSTSTEKSSSDFETNKMAERALIRLKQKLQGTEAGCVATNVEGQVNYLVQQARDPNNLCRLFHGWQAYL